MKQLCRFLLFAAILSLNPALLWAQDDAARAAAIAEREASEERYKRLNAQIEDLQAANVSLRHELSAIKEEIRFLREESSKSGNNYVTRQELRELALTVKEIDQKRDADNKRVLDEIHKLAKEPPIPAAPLSAPKSNVSAEKGANGGIEKGYWHTVDAGDKNLSLILQAYREQQGVKATLKQVLEANPGLNPNKIRPGQKIFIPDPSK